MMTEITTSYIICTMPRSGSTLLANGLASTGMAGTPAEYFDPFPKNQEFWNRRLNVTDDRDYLDKVISVSTSPNGVFGIKLHWYQLKTLKNKILAGRPSLDAYRSASLDALIQMTFGPTKYVWLRRRDKIAQGISFYKARMSGIWQKTEDSERPPPRQQKEAEYNYNLISKHIRLVVAGETRWLDFFKGQFIRPLMLFYEDLTIHYELTVNGVIRFLALPCNDILISPARTRLQSDELSLEWYERFAQDHIKDARFLS